MRGWVGLAGFTHLLSLLPYSLVCPMRTMGAEKVFVLLNGGIYLHDVYCRVNRE